MTDTLRIEYVALDELKRHPRNPKAHDLGAIHTSVNRFGYVNPVLIDERTGWLVAGHGRLDTLAQMKAEGKAPPARIQVKGGEWYVPVIRGVSFNSDAEVEAYLVADNRLTELGGWNEPELAALLQSLADEDVNLLEATGYDGEDLQALLDDLTPPAPAEDKGAQIDRAAELQQQWQTERGQLWIIPSKSTNGEHRLLCGDSTNAGDVARVMAGERAEMVWTDPPYGVSVGDKNKRLNAIARSNRVVENLTNDTLDEPELAAMLCAAFDCAMAVCTAGAAWYVAALPVPLHVVFGQALKERGIWRQTIQWVKNNATLALPGVDYHWRAEPIFYGWLPDAAHRFYGGRKQDNVWEIDRPQKSPEHPTMKPVELVARAIENSSKRGEIVYDPFGGSGTTMVACEQRGRLCRMIEIEPKYCAVILQRMVDVGLEPRLADGT